MDHLSSQYVRMASGPHSRLHQSTATVNFVEHMQAAIERSSAPRKNFLLDVTTPHGDVVITEASAMKPSIGWITLQVTEGIRHGVHEWCIKIESQGETTDGSGLMLGVLPKNFSKYDSFISQGGGWCLSRAGKLYGHWRRQDTTAGTLSFGTGDRVIFILDYEASTVTVRVGDKYIVAEISNLAPEVFPAVSLHYRHQHIRFKYHIVHDRCAKQLDWMERRVFPSAAAFLPLTLTQLKKLPLDSYILSPLFVDRPTQLKEKSRRSLRVTQGNDSNADLESQTSLEYASLEASTARLCVLINAFAAVRRYTEVSPAKGRFLAPHVTAEYLRKRLYESIARGVHGSQSHNVVGPSYDPTLNCGAVIVMHLFAKVAASGTNPMALPLVRSLLGYLLSLPLFSLAEYGGGFGAVTSAPLGSSVSPEVVQLAVDNIVTLVDSGMEASKENLSPLHASLMELATLLALQRGVVHETLRACRYLLRYPQGAVSRPFINWLQQNASALRPRRELPDLGRALKVICEDPEGLVPTRIPATAIILSVSYSGGSIFLHTADGVSRWMNPTSRRFVEVEVSKEPLQCCPGATRSSMAATLTHVFLLTNRMAEQGIAVVLYTSSLEVHRVYRLDEMDVTWPRESRANAQLLSGPEGQILLVYMGYDGPTVHVANGTAASAPSTAVGGARSSLAQAASRGRIEVLLQGFTFSAFPKPLWSTNLTQPVDSGDFTLRRCLALRKPGVVDLGPPDGYLHVPGGHVTVELWVMQLDRHDATTLYQHGDKTTSGEVFLETTRLEGAFSIRGGYRHDARGSCVVSAPLPPTAETRFLHVALLFDGRWHMFFDGEEVAGNWQGPHVSLDSPKQRWTVGSNCTCLLAGLRVWVLGRSAREVVRDHRRYLTGDEPGLVTQLFFNESSGNVVFNYVTCPRSRHAVCSGSFSHVKCDNHPWSSLLSHATPESVPRRADIHDWKDLALTRCFATLSHITLVAQVSDAAPYALASGRVFTSFDIKTGSAYSALFYLTSKSSSKGFMGCDDANHVCELFEMEQESGTNSGSAEMTICTATLPLEMTDEGDMGAALGIERFVEEASTDSRPGTSPTVNASSSLTEPSPFLSGQLQLGGRGSTPLKLSYSSLAIWLLRLLGTYASEEPNEEVSQLFSPLADDVSRRCTLEVKTALQEHFRVVKGTSSRRAVVLRSKVSTNVISCTLQVLLRLIRRVRAFGLHPSSVGLNVIDVDASTEDLAALLRELTATSMRRLASTLAQRGLSPQSSDDMSFSSMQSPVDEQPQGARTLLGILGDIINEAGATLPRELGRLAQKAVLEGIDLFITSVRCRARILQELLSMHPNEAGGNSASKKSTAPTDAAVERVPALEALLASTIRSLSTVLSASPLMYPQTDVTASRNAIQVIESTTSDALDSTCETLRVLISESLYHLRSHFMNQSKAASTGGEKPEKSHSNMSPPSSLPDAISSLQLLLLSNCQGIPVEQLLSSSFVTASRGVFSFPRTHCHSNCTKAYYSLLFSAADSGLSLVIRHTASLKEVAPVSLGSSLKRKAGANAGGSTCGGVDAVTWRQLKNSFLGAPLHAALAAIPLVVSMEDAPWFLLQLEALLPLCESLRQRLRPSYNTVSVTSTLVGDCTASPSFPSLGSGMTAQPSDHGDSPFAALYDATLLSASWIATCMLNATSTNTISSGDASSTTPAAAASPEVMKVCESALLAGGMDLGLLPAVAARKNTKSPRRSLLLKHFQRDGVKWVKVQSQMDVLAARVPKEILDLISLMAVTVLYLSCEPLSLRGSVEQTVMTVIRRLAAVRNQILQRRSDDKDGFDGLIQNMKLRCNLLLCATCCLEVNPVDDVLYRSRETCIDVHAIQASLFRSSRNGQDSLVMHANTFPAGPRERWRWARQQIRRCRFMRLADILSNEELHLSAAVALVSMVVQSTSITTVALQDAYRENQRLVALRLQGANQLLRLMRRESSCTESVSLLLSSDATGDGNCHYEARLWGCVRESTTQLRRTLCDMVEWLRDYQGVTPGQQDGSADDLGCDLTAEPHLHPPVLCSVLRRPWGPRDFSFFFQQRIVDSIFAQYGTIRGREASSPGSECLLQEESAAESRHREEALEYAERKMSGRSSGEGGGPAIASEEEDMEGTVLRTNRERNKSAAVNCLKYLGVQCAALLCAKLTCAEEEACHRFLGNLLDVISDELSVAVKVLSHKGPRELIPDTLREQMHLMTSLACTVLQTLPADLAFRASLSTSAVQLAGWTFQLALRELKREAASSFEMPQQDTNSSRSLLRLCSLLIRHSHPAIANPIFCFSEAQSFSEEVLGYWSDNGAVLIALHAFVVKSLMVSGLGARTHHATLALRQLLQCPRWATQLETLREHFTATVAQCGVDTPHYMERVRTAFSVYAWVTALGGVQLALPTAGMRVFYYDEDSRLTVEAYVVHGDAGSDTMTVVPTRRSATQCTGTVKQVDVVHDTPDADRLQDSEKQVCPDNVFLPPLQGDVDLPPYDGLVTEFLAPSLKHFFADLPEKTVNALTAVEIGAATGFLHIALVLIQRSPAACDILMETKAILSLNRFSRRALAQMPLPVMYLQEYAAYAMRSSFDLEVMRFLEKTLQSPADAPAHGSPLVPDLKKVSGSGPMAAGALPGSPKGSGGSTDCSTRPPPVRQANSSSLSVSLSPLAMLVNLGSSRETGLSCPVPSFIQDSPNRRDFAGPTEGTTATPTVCLFANAKGKSTSCVDITVNSRSSTATSGPNRCAPANFFPTWSDGISIETSLMLCDRVFPDLGEDYAIPAARGWMYPKMKLPLLTLYAASEAPAVPAGSPKVLSSTFPVLTVMIDGDMVVCTVQPFASSADNSVKCLLPLSSEDWDRFLHIGVVLDEHQMLLSKGGEMVAVPLSSTIGAQLSAVLRSEGRVKRLVVGASVPGGGSGRELPENPTMVFVSGVRMWGSSQLKASLPSMAEMVSRDQALSTFESQKDSLFFQFHELTGDKTLSEDGNFIGVLQGTARRAPCPFHVTPIVLDCPAKLHTGHVDDGVFMFPRSDVQSVFGALDVKGALKMSNQVLWSLVARMTRLVTVEAIRMSLSPDFELFKLQELQAKRTSPMPALPTSPNSGLFFNPFHLVETSGLAQQLGNLFRYSDKGFIEVADANLIDQFVAYILRFFVAQKQTRNIKELMEETPAMILGMLRETVESFTIEVATSGAASKGTPLFPLALVNGGKGGTLTFSARGKQFEQVTVYKDRAQKSLLMKYPDGQGGWPDCMVPSDQTWFYIRIFGHSRPHTLLVVAPMATIQVTVKSLLPVVVRYVIAPILQSLHSEAAMKAGLCAFLNTRTIVSLVQVGSASARGDACTHAVDVLTSLLHLWECHPDVQPFDQCPLHVALAHLNMPLVAVLQRGKSSTEGAAELSPTLGTYSAYTRSLFGLLVAAMRLSCRWSGQTYEDRIKQHWQRLKAVWEESARLYPAEPLRRPAALTDVDVVPAKSDRALITARKRPYLDSRVVTSSSSKDLTEVKGGPPPIPFAKLNPTASTCKAQYTTGSLGMVVLHPHTLSPPVATMHVKGNGEWFLRCDRGGMTARSDVGFTKGRLYFEVRVPEASSNLTIGVVTDQTCVYESEESIGQDASSWGFDSTRLCRLHKGYRSDFTARTKWRAGDVLGILMNLEQHRLTCVHNDRQISSFDNFGITAPGAGKNLDTLYFPAVSFGNAGCEVNFGAAPFAYSLPLGYIPVDPKHYCSPQAARFWLMMSSAEWIPPSEGEETLFGRRSNERWSPRHTPTKATPGAPHTILLKIKDAVGTYCEGRFGPLSVDLLCPTPKVKIAAHEVRVDDTPCVVRGGVSVTAGCWYYEVMVRGESGVSVGWTVADVEGEWGRAGKTLGDDEKSWALEGKRMIAKHDKHQTSLGRHVWREGDVIGCLLNCDAGSISYTINGTVQREVHDSDSDGVLFRHVDCGGAGLSPAVGLDCKTVVTFMWDRADLLYLPPGYKPIGASSTVTDAIVDHYLSDGARPVPTSSSLTLPMMERVVHAISQSVDLGPFHMAAYCLYAVHGHKASAGVVGETPRYETAGLAAALGMSKDLLAQHLNLLLAATAVADVLFPVAQVGSLPFDMESPDEGLPNALNHAYTSLRRYALPYLGLRALRRFLLATNGTNEGLKLSVNRRKAMAVVRDPKADVATKLRGSLFGQISSLLVNKSALLFCTHKKLWSVTFFGEGADDVGGPYRESLSQLCAELMSSDLPLFIPSPNQSAEIGESRETYVLNPSLVPPVSLSMYEFLGRLMGGCLRGSEPLSLYLPSLIWKTLVGEAPDATDLARTDLAAQRALAYLDDALKPLQEARLKWNKERHSTILDSVNEELAELCPDGFTFPDDAGRVRQLVQGGRDIQVNFTTAEYFLPLARQLKLCTAASPQLLALRTGFHQVIPLCAVTSIKWFELEELVCGQRDYDPDAFLDAAKYEQLNSDSDTRIMYLRQILREFNRRQRALFMRFVSGRERLTPGLSLRIFADTVQSTNGATSAPLPGAERRRVSSPSPIRGEPPTPLALAPSTYTERRISEPLGFNDERLPHASTCFYWLSLPRYSSAQVMREKLLYAIEQCMDIDADFRVHDNDVEQVRDEPTLARVSVEDDLGAEDFSHLV